MCERTKNENSGTASGNFPRFTKYGARRPQKMSITWEGLHSPSTMYGEGAFSKIL